jgi:hypothetical protein
VPSWKLKPNWQLEPCWLVGVIFVVVDCLLVPDSAVVVEFFEFLFDVELSLNLSRIFVVETVSVFFDKT